jgi:NAD(P)-dependent dehydrogenase (short-subunit alcohol dehydrogenase family)
MRPLEGRVALVTGAGRGIGRAIALGLAADGAAVGVNYRSDGSAAADVVRRITDDGGQAIAVRAAVGDPEAEAQLVAEVAPLGPVDLLVCNAGIASRGALVADSDPGEFERLLQIHALGPLRLMQALLPQMRARSRADIVLISSSEVAHHRPRSGPYTVAKAALEALALTLAGEEVAHGVRVNIIAPGLTATDMGDRLVRATLGATSAGDLDAAQPLGRITRPEDIAELTRFLAGAGGAQVTGQRITIDGGSAAHVPATAAGR